MGHIQALAAVVQHVAYRKFRTIFKTLLQISCATTTVLSAIWHKLRECVFLIDVLKEEEDDREEIAAGYLELFPQEVPLVF